MKPLPKIDLEQLKKQKEKNFRERLEFIDQHTEWLKKTPNKEHNQAYAGRVSDRMSATWSRRQKELID